MGKEVYEASAAAVYRTEGFSTLKTETADSS
jgi:hypothetical protein